MPMHPASSKCNAVLSAGITIIASVAMPRAFGGTAVLCAKFVVYYMQECVLEFRYPKQTLRKETL